MAKMKTISTEQLQQRMKQGNSLHLWNVLTDGYFKGEMIPGSRRVPLDTIGRELSDTQAPKGEEIIVYCGGPTCPQRSASRSKTDGPGLHQRQGLRGRPRRVEECRQQDRTS